MTVGDAQEQYAYVQKLIATRAAHTALQKGSYAELWRQNGGVANVFGFFRGDGADRVVVAISAGAAATVSLPIATSHALAAGAKARCPTGRRSRESSAPARPQTPRSRAACSRSHCRREHVGVYVAQ